MIRDIDEKKRILDSKRPFDKDAIKNLKKYFDLELTYNSNAIEGNTLTITETRSEYMNALEKASVENDLEDFTNIVATAVNRSLDTYLYIVG